MISPIKNKKEQNVRNQKEKLPLLSNPDGSAMGFFPGLCQVRSMLENKLVEVQFKVKRDHGWKQLFVFLFFKDGACVGGEYVRLRLIWASSTLGNFFPHGPFKNASTFSSSSGLSNLGVNFQILNSQQHGLPAVSRYHCQRPPRRACCFEESLT